MLRPWLAAPLIAVLAGLVSVAGQEPRQADRFQPLVSWLEAVEHHQPGTSDSALAVVAGYSIAELDRVSTDAHSLLAIAADARATTFSAAGGSGVRRRINYTRAEVRRLRALSGPFQQMDGANALVKRAAVLHTDVILRSGDVQEGTSSPRGTPTGLVLEMADGEHLGNRQTVPHLAFARTLLDLVKPTPSGDQTVRLWYQATLAALYGSERYEMPQIVRALELFPDDAEILFEAGWLHETLARSKVQMAIRAARMPMGATLAIGRSGWELDRAQSYLERALRANPDLVEARIRLGRVRTLRGNPRDAVIELQRARASTKNRLLLYYATLFLGAAEEAQHNVPGAREAYGDAAALYPTAPSPRLALSRLATVEGRDDVALQDVIRAVRVPPDAERADPWWSYDVAFGRNAPALMAALYRQVTAPPE